MKRVHAIELKNFHVTINAVAPQIPEKIILKDPKFLMRHDQALTKMGEDKRW